MKIWLVTQRYGNFFDSVEHIASSQDLAIQWLKDNVHKIIEPDCVGFYINAELIDNTIDPIDLDVVWFNKNGEKTAVNAL